MNSLKSYSILLISLLFLLVACKKSSSYQPGTFTITEVKAGNRLLYSTKVTNGVSTDSAFFVQFSQPVDTSTVRKNILIKSASDSIQQANYLFLNDYKTVRVWPVRHLATLTSFQLLILADIHGKAGEYLNGATYPFTTGAGTLKISSATLNDQNFKTSVPLKNIDYKSLLISVKFDEALDPQNFESYFILYPHVTHTCTLSESNTKVTLTTSADLKYYTHYFFNITSDLKAKNGNTFAGFANSFYTTLDSTNKFPLITDDELLKLIMHKSFDYFYDFAHPSSGMARERNNSGDIVTMGGSGFGVMALIVGMNEGFITRNEGVTRLGKILGFLESCDRFHGAWPHWLNGATGKVVPFTQQDDGADLVETSYMVQGLITMKHYLNTADPAETLLIQRITALCDAVEYDWFTRGQNVLYWHWSPNYNWYMNMQLVGYNETLIAYVVAASSTTHTISAACYQQGYARNGGIRNGNNYYGIPLPLGEPYGGPLFFTHYSFLGLDPRNLSDQYANYWQQNVNQSLINHAYCAANPHSFTGYSSACWGLTA
ncbi:MAG: glucoamylase family protein, partial [Bacteroidota bacterium]